MLPSTRNTMLGPSRRAIGMLAVAAVITLAAPTVYLSRAPAAAPEGQDVPEQAVREQAAADSHGHDEGKADGQPVRVELPGEGILELVAIGEHPSKDTQWWAPDGSPTAPPYQSFGGECHSENLLREMAVRWIKRPDEGVVASWSPRGDISASGAGQALDGDGKLIEGLEAMDFAIRQNPKTCGLAVRVAAGPWQTLCEVEGDSNGTGIANAQHAFAFAPAIEAAGKVVLTVSHDVLGEDIRVIAVDFQGKTIGVGVCQQGGMKKFAQTTATFANLDLAEVRTFQVQSRPFEHFEIRDISLWPGERTMPKVVKITPEREQMDRTEAVLRQRMQLLDKVDDSTELNK